MPASIAVLTMPDIRTAANDTPGKALAERIKAAGYRIAARAILPDDAEAYQMMLNHLLYHRQYAGVPFEDQAMTPQAVRTYEYDIDVVADDIDELGHVNNAIYLKWVQAAVLRHWHCVAPKEIIAAYLWVALKHEIRYRHPGFLNDHVVIRVVLKKLLGARAFYKTMINRGDEVLAEVESCWCCLDSVTNKPVRLARDIVARFLPVEAPRRC